MVPEPAALHLDSLRGVLSKYPGIRQALVFGSAAGGTMRP